MLWFGRAYTSSREVIGGLYDFIVSYLTGLQLWFHAQLRPLNLPSEAETVVLLFAFMIVAIAVAKLFGGALRLVLLIILIGLALDVLVPALAG